MTKFHTSALLSDWLESAEEFFAEQLNQDVIIISLLGKDATDRSKGEDLNDFLGFKAFPSFTSENHALNIDIFFSPSDDVVYMVVNGPSDQACLNKMFLTDTEEDFFSKTAKCDDIYLRMLHFVFIISHIVVIVEPVPRVDLSLVKLLKDVNYVRVKSKKYIMELIQQSGFVRDKKLDGRTWIPRLVFGFHRNVIRNELGAVKKEEIYEKLENNLEEQLCNIFKYSKIIQYGRESLACMPEHCVALLNPGLTTENCLADMLDLIKGKHATQLDEKRTLAELYLDTHIFDVRKEIKKEPHEGAYITLSTFIATAKALLPTLHINNDPNDKLSQEIGYLCSGTENFLDVMTDRHVQEATKKYWSCVPNLKIVSKAEHAKGINAAVAYLNSVMVESREHAMELLMKKCDHLYSDHQACDQVSITGHNCVLPDHPFVGDLSRDESLWSLHKSTVTYISTCSCGRTQTLRKDPFTLKEANYDFLHENPYFTCCKGLERHHFPVLEDEENTTKEELWTVGNEWNDGDDNSIVSKNTTSRNVVSKGREGSDSSQSQEDSVEIDSEKINDQSSADSDDNSAFSSDSDYEDAVTDVKSRESRDFRLEMAIKFNRRLKQMEMKKTQYLSGIFNTSGPSLLPLYPSWTLTCIGPSSVYSHPYGLRDQPNFKISGEFLLPVDIDIQVNPHDWEQDMECMFGMLGSTRYTRPRKSKRQDDIEKVKLFVGFDYECPRGHRFFVGHNGNPLVLPMGQTARNTAIKEAAVGILESDLPLRRQCTCKKQPYQIAQLTKVHIVTPKAPVTVTLDPQVIIPDHEGVFSTGEGPLPLLWARYYILQLPFVYSGPQGVWTPPTKLKEIGTYKANSIKVTYTRRKYDRFGS